MKLFLPVSLSMAVLAAIALVASPAHAFTDSDARKQIEDLKQELREKIKTISNGQLDVSSQNEKLRTENARLRGQIEVLAKEIESLKTRQNEFYADLDNRQRRLEAEAARAAQARAAAEQAAIQRASGYENGLNLLKAGRHAEALGELNNFISNNPDSAKLPAAYFWAGSAALQAGQNATALKHFRTVLATYPDESVAPDAMLGIANTQIVIGEQKNARLTLQSLIKKYPTSTAAKTAKQHLSK